ncbi:conserved hypothetical protein [Cupriavidus taiwanensis]|nr:conserved hypothetical protein [Cupriavidus taiwanensis]
MPCNARAVNVEIRPGAARCPTYRTVMQHTHLPRPSSIVEKDEILMYIVAIGWLYVALMMAITEHNVVAGVATFLMYGVAPVALVLYIMGTPGRRRRKAEAERALEQSAPASEAAKRADE